MKNKIAKNKLTKSQKQIIKALEHIFTIGGWEIPDSAVEGKLSAKVRELERRINSLTNTQTVQRIDVLATKKGGAK